MGTGNFWQGDEPYIYVPIMFRGIEKLDDDEIQMIYDEFFGYELENIIKDIVSKVREISNEYYKKYDGEIEIIYHGKRYVRKFNTQLHYIEIVERSDTEGEIVGSIYFGFVPGNYIAGNMIYLVERDEYFSKKTDEAIDRILDVIEKVYSQYCDKYIVRGVFSSGETIYEKYDDEEE